MTSMPVESPRRGDKMRASWGAAVADRVNECADAIDVLRGPGSLDSMRGDAASAGVAPFTVRYDTEEEVWLIYLPLGCVNVGGTCHPINLQPPQSQQGQQPRSPTGICSRSTNSMAPPARTPTGTRTENGLSRPTRRRARRCGRLTT